MTNEVPYPSQAGGRRLPDATGLHAGGKEPGGETAEWDGLDCQAKGSDVRTLPAALEDITADLRAAGLPAAVDLAFYSSIGAAANGRRNEEPR
ncbi:hypothetical protein [Streptomyces sp. NRRL F-5650]|uniref:hypothetical protein n=1 Tax=Streptomyces sp. NRRL F-5650 TaxID=1463868 RepID=UPI001F1E2F93|nr:hypothetical protein [Streptomyces sp. NRRL F-5650]